MKGEERMEGKEKEKGRKGKEGKRVWPTWYMGGLRVWVGVVNL